MSRFGRFQIREELGAGEGAMGRVYRAYDPKLDREVALKEVQLGSSAVSKEQAQAEARLMAQITHSAIVTIHEILEVDENLVLVMELLEGRTLKHVMERQSFTVPEMLSIMNNVCEAVKVIHDNGIIHRDLKPSNIMMTKTGPKLFDFGVATPSYEDRTMVAGTTKYMAPELFELGQKATGQADVYSLGLMFYEAFIRPKMFDEVLYPMNWQQWQTWHRDVTAALPLLHETRTDVPQAVSDVVMKMCEKDCNRRYANMDEVLRALRAACTGVGAPTPSSGAAPAEATVPLGARADATVPIRRQAAAEKLDARRAPRVERKQPVLARLSALSQTTKIALGAGAGAMIVLLVIVLAIVLLGDNFDEYMALGKAAYQAKHYVEAAKNYDLAKKEVKPDDPRAKEAQQWYMMACLRNDLPKLDGPAGQGDWPTVQSQVDDLKRKFLHPKDAEGRQTINDWDTRLGYQDVLAQAADYLAQFETKQKQMRSWRDIKKPALDNVKAGIEKRAGTLKKFPGLGTLLAGQTQAGQQWAERAERATTRIDFLLARYQLDDQEQAARKLQARLQYADAVGAYGKALRYLKSIRPLAKHEDDEKELDETQKRLESQRYLSEQVAALVEQFQAHLEKFEFDACEQIIGQIEVLQVSGGDWVVKQLRARIEERKLDEVDHQAFLVAQEKDRREPKNTKESYEQAIQAYEDYLAQVKDNHWKGIYVTDAEARITELRQLLWEHYDNLIARARRFMAEGDYATAVEVLNNAIRFAPGLQLAYTLKGSCLTEMDQLDEAERVFAEAEQAGGEHLDPMFFLARAKLRVKQSRFDDAEADLTRALAGTNEIERPELWGEAAEIRGDIRMMKEEYEAAILDYRRGAELLPKSWQILLKLAIAYNRHGAYEDSIRTCDQAYELEVKIADRQVARILYVKACGLARLDRLDDADEFLLQALSWDLFGLRALIENPQGQTYETHWALATVVNEAKEDGDLFAIRERKLMTGLRRIYNDFLTRNMALVPAATFTQGDRDSKSRDERATRQVQLDAFFLGRTEVTNAQYAEFLDWLEAGGDEYAHPSQPAGKSHVPVMWAEPRWGKTQPTLPVVGVDWYDAYAFAAWSEKRLPTEAEWERAAKGAGEQGRRYPWGNKKVKGINIDREQKSTVPSNQEHLAADVTEDGVYGLGGNVSEWCQDVYDSEYYGKHSIDVRNPVRERSDKEEVAVVLTDRVIRGGAWDTNLISARPAHRGHRKPDTRDDSIGFRCALTAEPDLVQWVGKPLPQIELPAVSRPAAPTDEDENPTSAPAPDANHQ